MLFLIISTSLGCFIGYTLSLNYKRKYLMYKELEEFLNYFKLKVSSSQTKIKDVTNEFFSKKNKPFFPYKKYIEFFENKHTNAKFELEDYAFLNSNEKKELEDLVLDLGQLSLREEIEKINIKLTNVNQSKIEKQSNYKKYGLLYIKLGLIFGLLLGIIFI